jgi:ABC-2 type transport system permease protein
MGMAFLLGFPLVFMLLFGSMFVGDTVPNYPIGVIDEDNTTLSQTFVTEALAEVPTIEVVSYEDSTTAWTDLELGDIKALIVIPNHFGESVSRNWQGEDTDIILDATYDESDLMVSQQIIATINAATRSFARIEVPVDIKANPIHIETEITNIDFIAPGIIIFGLLIMIPTSAHIMVRDKEKGFLSRLLTTPTRPAEFITGYSLAMVVVSVAQIIIFMLIGWMFGMDIVGNLWLAFAIFLLTALGSIGIGMVVASLSKSANQAESLCWLFSMPLAILSGVWFSAEMMPAYLRAFARIFPYAHAVDASRAVLLRGSGMEAITGDFWFLVGWAVVIFAFGILLFRRTMRT